MEENIQENALFTNFISGVKGISLNTTVLLIDDIPNKSLNFFYNIFLYLSEPIITPKL